LARTSPISLLDMPRPRFMMSYACDAVSFALC
jgi:hypothetical protein